MPIDIPANPIAAIPKRRLKSILKNPAKTAEAVNLVYKGDTTEGIIRKKVEDGFEYYYQGKKVKDEATLAFLLSKMAICRLPA
jgi:hypothetical protein